jgi:ribosome-binding protein aMBF1 (putative translation factor)
MNSYKEHLNLKLKSKSFKNNFKEESYKIRVAYEIFKLRQNKKMSQEVLAKKIGTTQSVVARMEAGKQNLSIDTLQKIAKVFDKDIKASFV